MYKPTEKHKRSFLCDLFNGSGGRNLNDALFTTPCYGLTIA